MNELQAHALVTREEPASEIPDALERLGRVLDDLMSVAEALRARAEPVLRETSNPVGPVPDLIPAGSPIGRQLDARITQAQAVSEVLSNVLDRIEV